jgi:indole-3-glycerol phosphate synthase
MSAILDRIVARTRERLIDAAKDVEDTRLAARRIRETRSPFAFSSELKKPGVRIIAEIKSASPSAGMIVENPDVEAIARDYQRGGAAAISIVTEPEFFRGSTDWIGPASSASGLPVVMKDFIVEESQVMHGLAAGADAVLLLASQLGSHEIRHFISVLDSYGCDALVEVHDEEELERAMAGGARIVGVNNRDLRDFHVDLAVSEGLAPKIPRDVTRVAESGIKSHRDIERLQRSGFHSFLVGESLLRQNDRVMAIRELVGAGRQ